MRMSFAIADHRKGTIRTMLKKLINRALDAADDFCVGVGPEQPAEAGTFVTVLFHKLHEDGSESRSELAPQLSASVEFFREFVQVMLEGGYALLSPAQVHAGFKPAGRHLMITFDDGYFNNTLALSVLEEFRVPATFFVSVGNVLENKAFWWDALSRQLSRAGTSQAIQKASIETLKTQTPQKIESYLREHFGSSVLEPGDDRDRPFTPGELSQFAQSPWVHLGNHTRDHAILTNCAPQEIAHQIRSCQETLAELVGYCPIAIAYPNGNHSPQVVEASMAAGLRLGFTVLPQRSRVNRNDESRMMLGRYFVSGQQGIRQQCRKFGAKYVPSHALKSLIRSGY
jgi:peptidoglycan/xylan/chitin deacetylase (PgdA/CDA1 family)